MFKLRNKEKGFTLIELMTTNMIMIIVFTMVVSLFVVNKQKLDYQSDKSARIARMDFALLEVSKAIRGSVSYPWNEVQTIPAVDSGQDTVSFAFKSFDSNLNPVSPYVVRRMISFNSATGELFLQREAGGVNQKLLSNVMHFKIFNDIITPRAGFTGIPLALPNRSIILPNGTADVVNSYTVMVEISIPARNANIPVNNSDVRGNAVVGNETRVWRYLQIYPENGELF